MKEQDFISFDGQILHLYVFDEVETPKGIVQIVHGMQESMATYFEFCKFLNKSGFYAVGVDLRVHGKTACDLSKIGCVDEPLFENIVRDQMFLADKIKGKSSLPITIMGHSYGSFITQRLVQVYDGFDKVILSGSAYMKKPLILFGKFISSVFCALGGRHKKANLIENMSFKSYQKNFDTGCWITSDEEEAKKFYDDEMNALPFENAFYFDMFRNQLKLYIPQEMMKINKTKPIYIISGECDPIGEFSKSTKRLFEEYKKYHLNVKMKLYPECRHGLVQEKNRADVFQDILKFLV